MVLDHRLGWMHIIIQLSNRKLLVFLSCSLFFVFFSSKKINQQVSTQTRCVSLKAGRFPLEDPHRPCPREMEQRFFKNFSIQNGILTESHSFSVQPRKERLFWTQFVQNFCFFSLANKIALVFLASFLSILLGQMMVMLGLILKKIQDSPPKIE